jgi:glucose-1-phosphate adenylyltransferase
VIVDRNVVIPRGAVIGYRQEEDRKRHTVSEQGVVVVTKNDSPYCEDPSPEALALEAEADRRGHD